MLNKKPCKYLNNDICGITNFRTDRPHCNSCVSYEEKLKCPICKDYIDEKYTIDTEGLLNGGIGIICEQCWENCK